MVYFFDGTLPQNSVISENLEGHAMHHFKTLMMVSVLLVVISGCSKKKPAEQSSLGSEQLTSQTTAQSEAERTQAIDKPVMQPQNSATPYGVNGFPSRI